MPQTSAAYSVRLPVRFAVLFLSAAAIVAFGVGRFSRFFLLERTLNSPERQQQQLAANVSPRGLPPPIVKGQKRVPQTVYTTRNYDTSRSVSSSLFLQALPQQQAPLSPSPSKHDPARNQNQSRTADKFVKTPGGDHGHVDRNQNQTVLDSENHIPNREDTEVQDENEDKDQDQDEIYMPAGQHLLVDFDNVDEGFLNSESRLATAMVDMVYECGLTMLSYHCHRLFPSGVSCAGVLLESHVSFHTWPEEGVITLDLFTCGSTSLLPMVPMIEGLFSVPRRSHNYDQKQAKPQVLWAYKRRGFTDVDAMGNTIAATNKHETMDLFTYPLGSRGIEMKQEVVSMETDRHRLRIYDVIQAPAQTLAAYDRSLSNDGSYEAKNPNFFLPDRLVFVDGVIQTRRSRDAPSHETLVHPAMFSHPSPVRVVLVGGGTDGGAALREVLKHNTVREVTLLMSQPTLIDMSREHMAEWNDCSNIIGSAPSCFDDRRVRMVFGRDPTQWFSEPSNEGNYDVIVIDALDRSGMDLHSEADFFPAVHQNLSPEGVVVFHTHKDDTPRDLPVSPMRAFKKNERYTANLSTLFRNLKNAGFLMTRSYDENLDGYTNTRSYAIAFKGNVSARRWDRTEARVQVDIARRSARTKDGSRPFRYFDGASMASYRALLDVKKALAAFRSTRNNLKAPTSQSASTLTGFGQDIDSNVSYLGSPERNKKVTLLRVNDLVRAQPFLSSIVSMECPSS